MRIIRQTLLGLAVICLIIGFGGAASVFAGSYSDPVNVSIPYTQIYNADSTRSGDVFTYQVKPEGSAPAPTKSTFDIKADPKKAVKGSAKLSITFPNPGAYYYEVKAKSGPKVDGIKLDNTVYRVQVRVKNSANGGLAVDTVQMTSSKSNKKQYELSFNPTYTPPVTTTKAEPTTTKAPQPTTTSPQPTTTKAPQPTTTTAGGNGGNGNGGNGGNGNAPAAAAAQPAPINDEPPEPPTADIGDDVGPQAAPDAPGIWSVLNLLLAIATVLAGIILLIRFFGRIDTDQDEYVIRRGGKWRLAGIVLAVIAAVAFLVTEHIPGNIPVLIDEWTPLMVIIFALAVVLCIYVHKHYKTDNGEQTKGA